MQDPVCKIFPQRIALVRECLPDHGPREIALQKLKLKFVVFKILHNVVDHGDYIFGEIRRAVLAHRMICLTENAGGDFFHQLLKQIFFVSEVEVESPFATSASRTISSMDVLKRLFREKLVSRIQKMLFLSFPLQWGLPEHRDIPPSFI